MTDEYATSERRPLDIARLEHEVRRSGTAWGTVRVVQDTASTQHEARVLVDAGERLPFAVIAESQWAGRGRLDRTWSAPPASSILMSAALPRAAHAGALPLHVGTVVATALQGAAPGIRLKWPNDLVVEQPGGLRKLGGIIAEVHSDAVIIGIGINITMAGDELPTAEAISLAQLSVQVSREPLIAAILDGLAGISADASLDRYREFCVTIGALVEVSRISDEPLQGLVVGIDESGALRLLAAGVEHSVTVGDVRHLRPGT